jgi:hypothetical protein
MLEPIGVTIVALVNNQHTACSITRRDPAVVSHVIDGMHVTGSSTRLDVRLSAVMSSKKEEKLGEKSNYLLTKRD